MKTIEEAAKETYSYNVDEFTWISDEKREAFITGVEFAQRWIPVEEELPENSMNIESKGNYKYTPQVIYKTKNNKVGITRREEFLDHGFRWRGSGSLQYGIISWRPIDLK